MNTLLSRTLEDKGCELPGVSTPYLYFGMWRSTFAWYAPLDQQALPLTNLCELSGYSQRICCCRHTEDCDLHSVNYLHFGAPKTWYIVPPQFRTKFENALKNELQDLPRQCPEFLRHKVSCPMRCSICSPECRSISLPKRLQVSMRSYPAIACASFWTLAGVSIIRPCET